MKIQRKEMIRNLKGMVDGRRFACMASQSLSTTDSNMPPILSNFVRDEIGPLRQSNRQVIKSTAIHYSFTLKS